LLQASFEFGSRGSDYIRRYQRKVIVLMCTCADPARAVFIGDLAHFERIFPRFRSIVQTGEQVTVNVDKRDHAK
jgi:hypothetical protein